MIRTIPETPPRPAGLVAPRLPRLALISDCSAEASVAGQLLLYRLLQDYEPNDLIVFEGDVLPSTPNRRLPGVAYRTVRYKPYRFESRLYAFWNSWLLSWIRLHAPRVAKIAGERRVEAVLTVAHGHLWVLASEVARLLRVPLHLIIHDDITSAMPVALGTRRLLRRRFAAVYRGAASRLCVSPYMARDYERLYGAAGVVLLPSRSAEVPPGRVRVRSGAGGFVLAYAGSIPNSDYVVRLRAAVDAVREVGGIFHLYTNAAPARLEANGLCGPGVRFHGYSESGEVIERLAATADALFVPMSFAAEDRRTMEVSFPSKLADYTAAGLPILIWAPEYAGAAKWAADNPDVALCVTRPEASRLVEALRRLRDDRGLRERLASGAVETGQRQFSFEAAAGKFRAALRGESAL